FSGQDGRTTIFDYWTIDTLRRWRNGGKYTPTKLTADERTLHAYYSKLLNMAGTYEAFTTGPMFDLMYANYDNPHMDTNHQFAFLRRATGELMLVVTNFEDRPVDTAVNIPAHAFTYLNIPQGPAFATDLLTDATQTIDLLPDTTLPLTLPPLGGIVLRMEVK
ncbi:MAG: alpha-amylase, partial [Bacteroidaceae bacterium]|nr:alpha-amylase [Bacteroidaceae bacterium]